MTIREGIDLLVKGRLTEFDRNKPAGTSISHNFILCVNCCFNNELDSIGEKCLGVFRYLGTTAVYNGIGGTTGESDDDYRKRLVSAATTLDLVTFLDDVVGYDNTMSCSHKYATYHGLLESYDYCVRCGEKKT